MLTRARDGTLRPSITSQREEEANQTVRSTKGRHSVTKKKSVKAFLDHVKGELEKIAEDDEFFEAFELPPRWVETKLQVPPYRNLKQNLYKPPLHRPEQDEDDILTCNCSLQTGGCNSKCQNRLMYT
jgi:hypothetical protein